MELLCRKYMNGFSTSFKSPQNLAVMLNVNIFLCSERKGQFSHQRWFLVDFFRAQHLQISASCFSTHNLKSVVTSVMFPLFLEYQSISPPSALQNTTLHFHVWYSSHKLLWTSTDPRSSKLHRPGDKNKHVVDVVKRSQFVQVQATKPLGQIEENIVVQVKTRGLLDVMLHYAVRQVVYAKRRTYVNVLVLRGSQTPASFVSYFCVTHPSSPAPPQLGRCHSLYST